VLQPSDLRDLSDLRDAYLAWLEDWPKRSIGGASFDDRFSLAGRWSLWWVQTHCVDQHPFRGMQAAWTCCRALEHTRATDVRVQTDDPRVASAIASWCTRRHVRVDFAASSARPQTNPLAGRWRWLLAVVGLVFALPVIRAIRALAARWLQGTPSLPKGDRHRPAVAMLTECPRHLEQRDGAVEEWYWRSLREQLQRIEPDLRHVLIPYTGWSPGHRQVRNVYDETWRLLRSLPRAAGLRERHWLPWSTLVLAARQIPLALRYARMESSNDFIDSFQLEGMDISAFFVPVCRQIVMAWALRELKVLDAHRSLASAGEIRVLLLVAEFGNTARPYLIASQRLGIRTFGVQHGSIYPLHASYVLPRGQVRDAPMPDAFAAYGQQSAEVVSGIGHYPKNRVWVTGAPRLDHWVTDPPDPKAARRRLGIDPDRPVIFVATQNYPWFQRAARAVFAEARRRPDWLVCLKTHPFDVPVDVYRRIAEEVGCDNALLFADQFDDLLAACDVLVSGTSTSILEAILAGKSALSVNFTHEPERYPYVADGGALPGRTPEEVAASLTRALDPACRRELGARREAFLRRHMGPTSTGRGAVELAGRIVELAGVR
jgi:hypothetical protein